MKNTQLKKALAIFAALSLTTTFALAAPYAPKDAKNFTNDTAGNANQAGLAAGADDKTGTEIGSKEIPIKFQTTGANSTTNVYALTYSDSEVVFTYQGANSKIWNPVTLMYEAQGTAGGWDKTSQEITVTNYSDVAVNVAIAIDNTSVTGVTLSADKTSLDLASAYSGDDKVKGTEKSDKFNIQINGNITGKTYPTAEQVAKVTMTVTRK